jgi:Nucleotidyltransferase of unknown function (DUF6036)
MPSRSWINRNVNEPLRITLSDVESFLESNRVPHALIGGLAVSLRGQPRATVDVDMVIAVDVARTLELVVSLSGSNFQPLFADVAEVVERSFILPLRHRSTQVKVDLSIGLSGFERNAVERAQRCDVADTVVPVATAEDLIIMKALAGRPRDEQDLQGLVVAQGDSLDWVYCERVATELGEALGVDLVAKIRSLRDDRSRGS